MASITPIEYKVEFAFGADKTDTPTSWAWVDLTNRTTADSAVRLYDQQITIQMGSSDESRQVQPATTSLTLHNFDGAVTPGNPNSPWYPNIRRGTPCRLSIHTGSNHLQLPGQNGSYASTPDNAALDITDDIFVAIDATLYTGAIPGVNAHFVSKWNTTGSRSWRTYLANDGLFHFDWSADGTNLAGQEWNDIPLPIALDGRIVWAVGLVSDDGGGNHVLTWYHADSFDGPWIIHEQQVLSGTTSIFSSSAILEIGTQTNGIATTLSVPFLGEINAVQVRQGDDSGTIVANPDFTAEDEGTTSFADSAGRTWTVNGDAEINSWKIRFLGEVAEWSPTWPSGNLPGNAEVKVTAAGVLRRLTQGAKALNSTLYRTITNPARNTVFAYWPFEDGASSTSVASALPDGAPMLISGTYNFAGDSNLDSSNPLMTVGSGDNAYMEAAIPPIPQVVGVNWMVTRIFRINDPAVAPATTQLMAVDTNGRVATWRVAINDAQVAISGVDSDESGVVLDTITADSRMFDTYAFVMLKVTDDGVNVDWELHIIPIPAGLDFSISGTYVGNTGIPLAFRNSLTGPPGGVTVGHLVFTFDEDVSWTAPADTAYVGEPATRRIARLCAEEGLPFTIDGSYCTSSANWEDVDESVSRMGPQKPLSLVDLLKDCAEVDLGVLSEMRYALGIAYRARSTIQSQTPQLTWDMATRGVINPFDPTLDDQRITNEITVTRTGGSSFKTLDEESIVMDGRYESSVDINIQLDSHLPDQAGWRLRLGTWPDMRYPSFTLELNFADDLIEDWVNFVLGDRTQITNLPEEHVVDLVDLLVEGYSETFSQWVWSSTLNCSPAGPWDVGVVEDDVYGRADTEGSILYETVTSSDTSFDVAVTDGPLWTTDSSEFPFSATCGGEEWTVSDIDPVLVTFGATGTVTHANNASVTPGIPASVAAGNLLLVFAAIRNSGTGVPDTPSGYARLPVFPEDSNAQLFAKVAVGGDAAPTITFTGGVANADTSAQMIRLGGSWSDPENVTAAYGSVLNASAQDIEYPGTRIVTDNCLVLYLGWKQDDWTSVATVAGATEVGEPDTTTGDDQGIVWDYVIQTTAATIAPGSFVVTGGASAISRGAVIALRCDRQTWTVTRGVNGVTKAQTAGTSVSLTHPMVAAL